MIETVGGCAVLLGLVAMSRDTESLYAAVKSLLCVLRSNPLARRNMDKERGYQIMAMLLRKKVRDLTILLQVTSPVNWKNLISMHV